MAKKKPTQADLPTLENRAIQILQDLATEYASIRDSRIELNKQEFDLKSRVRKEMKRRNRTTYSFDGVEIELIAPETIEDVKVRIRKPKDEASETDETTEAEESGDGE